MPGSSTTLLRWSNVELQLGRTVIGVNSYGFPNRVWHVPVETYRDHWERLLGGDRWGGTPRIVHTFKLGQGMQARPMPARADRGRDLVRPLAKKAAASVVRILCDGKQTCLGTVLTKDGLIATKASELTGKITCRLDGGEEPEARRVRVLEKHDLALLQVESEGLVPVRWAECERAEIGRWVVVPGPAGELLGVGVVGVERLAAPLQIGALGAQFGADVTAAARIEAVAARSPATQSGLQPGDVITAVDGKKTPAIRDVLRELSGRPPDSQITLRVGRGEESLEREVRLGQVGGRRAVRVVPQGGAQIVIMRPGSGRSPASKRQDGFPEVFQHEARIRPSDCGTPLIGLDGRALGISISRISGPASYGLPAGVIAAEVAK